MNIHFDDDTTTVSMKCNSKEYSTFKHIVKVFGNNFLKTYMERFVNQREQQKVANRKEKLGDKFFNELNESQQNEVLGIMNLTFDDE